jgi:hypothetical protein
MDHHSTAATVTLHAGLHQGEQSPILILQRAKEPIVDTGVDTGSVKPAAAVPPRSATDTTTRARHHQGAVGAARRSPPHCEAPTIRRYQAARPSPAPTTTTDLHQEVLALLGVEVTPTDRGRRANFEACRYDA